MKEPDPVRSIWKKDGRYKLEAYQFLFDSLDQAVRLAGRDKAEGNERHVTGQELLAGMREHALNLFGPLAAQVWRSWGVHETLDWGKIVFLLVEAKLLNRQEEDTIEDFRDGFDFDTAFVDGYRPVLPPELGARPQPDDEA
ncbi:MAG: hypothetical protein GY711_12650 [bacterium]|nr:hypothetical protein [bacterium]